MKNKFIFIALLGVLACAEQDTTPQDLTGKKLQYPLLAGSGFEVSGVINILEEKSGQAEVEIKLNGLSGSNFSFPVHLHAGGIDNADAPLVATLTPIVDKKGESKTMITMLTDGRAVSYQDFVNFNGSIKIHLAVAGEGRKIVLASGNIGSLYSTDVNALLRPVAECKD